MSTTPTTSDHRPHLGRNIERIRDLRGIKQDALAKALGITQQAVSRMEQSEEVEEERLQEVARVLDVSPEAIRNFSEEAAIYNIQHNYEGSNANATVGNNVNYDNCTFNPFDELLKMVEENKKLYERMLKDKDAMIEKLERLLQGRPQQL
jgi:transcriptional regulator with XRE-family HTH domain